MRKANARERILESAGRLFMERGYSEVGINEIIATAETAKASFYQHFPSKAALCEAWLQSLHDHGDASREHLLQSDLTAPEKVDRYFAELGKYLKKSKFRGCPFSNTGAVVCCDAKGISAQIRTHKEAIRGFFESICQEFFSEKTTASHSASTLFLLYSGATTEAQNLRKIWPVDTARKAAAELMKT